jgi:hypothetical protein
MAWTYETYPDHELIFVRFVGAVTGEELVACAEAVLSDPANRPGYRRVWDGSDIESMDISPEMYGHLTATIEAQADTPGRGSAAIVAGPGTDPAIASLLAARTRKTGTRIQVFRRVRDALKWLEVDEGFNFEQPAAAGSSGRGTSG